MKKNVVAAVLGILAVWSGPLLAGPAHYDVGQMVDDVKIEESLTFGSSPANIQLRTMVAIPQDFGKIITIYPDTAGVVIWFESGDGKMRNVLIKDKGPLVIRRHGKLD